MSNVLQKRLLKKNVTKEWLFDNGFRFNRLFSDENIEVYTYRFPVYKYENFTILECELRIISGSGNVIIDVYDYGTINKYAPFYYQEYGNYGKMLEKIWAKINKVIKELGIEEGEASDGSKNKKDKRRCNYTNKRK